VVLFLSRGEKTFGGRALADLTPQPGSENSIVRRRKKRKNSIPRDFCQTFMSSVGVMIKGPRFVLSDIVSGKERRNSTITERSWTQAAAAVAAVLLLRLPRSLSSVEESFINCGHKSPGIYSSSIGGGGQ